MQPLGSMASGWSGQFSSHCTACLSTPGVHSHSYNPAVFSCKQQACDFLVCWQKSPTLCLPGFDQEIWPDHSQMLCFSTSAYASPPAAGDACASLIPGDEGWLMEDVPHGIIPKSSLLPALRSTPQLLEPLYCWKCDGFTISFWLGAGPTIPALSLSLSCSQHPLGMDAPAVGSKEGSQCGCPNTAPARPPPEHPLT